MRGGRGAAVARQARTRVLLVRATSLEQEAPAPQSRAVRHVVQVAVAGKPAGQPPPPPLPPDATPAPARTSAALPTETLRQRLRAPCRAGAERLSATQYLHTVGCRTRLPSAPTSTSPTTGLTALLRDHQLALKGQEEAGEGKGPRYVALQQGIRQVHHARLTVARASPTIVLKATTVLPFCGASQQVDEERGTQRPHPSTVGVGARGTPAAKDHPEQ